MRRELIEELGIKARSFDPIGIAFAAPGYSTERIHFFYAPITGADFIDPDAHGADEGEDVRRVEQSRKIFLQRLAAMAFADVKLAAISGWAITHLQDTDAE